MKNKIIETIKSTMQDTSCPVHGYCFEKKVKVDFATFCAFALMQWGNITITDNGRKTNTIYNFYTNAEIKDLNHKDLNLVAIYFSTEKVAYFGGLRWGSATPKSGLITNPFKFFKGELE